MNKSSWSLLLMLSLTGCMGVYQEGFDCPPGSGVGCKSISQVNALINQGKLPQEEKGEREEPSFASSCKGCTAQPSHSLKPTVWFSPKWEGKISSQPIHLLPEKDKG